jgi:hypothetical protein
MINPQIAIGAALVAIGFGSGWAVNGWRHDSIQLAVDSAASAMADLTRKQIAGLATELEAKIASGVVTQRIIERGVIKEIRKNEIVYRNVCITDDGRMLINSAAKGRISSQSASAVP